MSLELDIDLRPTEQPDEPIEQPTHPVAVPHERRATGKRHEPGGEPIEILQRQGALALGRIELHAGQQPAQVPIPLRRLDQHRQTPETGNRPSTQARTTLLRMNGVGTGGLSFDTHTVCSAQDERVGDRGSAGNRRTGGGVTPAFGDRQLAADNRFDAGRERRLVESRCSIHPVPIEQGERGISQLGRPVDQGLGQGRAIKKRERGRCVELDIHGRRSQETGDRRDRL